MKIENAYVNAMCTNCARFGKDCEGTTCKTWTGCALKKAIDPEKVICKPRLTFNEQDKGTDHAYNVQLWHSYDGGKTFYSAGYGRFFGDYYEAEAWRKAQRKNLAYDLMFCCLGNGLTVCNRAREEHGDYQYIAHICECGAVSWYKQPETLPDYAREEINEQAAAQAKKFRQNFVNLPKSAALDRLNDVLYIGQFITVFQKNGIAGKSVEEIYNAFIEYTCRNGKRTMPQQ